MTVTGRARHCAAIVACIAASGLGGSSAYAAGYAIIEQGAINQGTAHAGAVARAQDPTTLFFNPAGMTRLDGYQISLNTSFLALSSKASDQSASRLAGLGGGAISGTADGPAKLSTLVPSVFATAAITPELHVGLSITAPYGLSTKYTATSLSRYYGMTTSLRTYDIAPSFAWRVLPALSLSASLIVETADAHLSDALDFGSVGSLSGLARFGLRPGNADGYATLRGSDTQIGWQLGALYEPLPGTRIGLTYRAGIGHDLQGDVRYQAVPALLASGFVSQPGTAKIVTPAYAILGAAQEIGRWTLLGQVQWTQWSEIHALRVQFADGRTSVTPENWHDAWAATLGTDYRLNDALTIRAGTGLDTTPTGADRTPSIPDSARIDLSTGMTWQVTKSLALSAAYSHLFGSTVSVDLTDRGPGTANFLRGNLRARFQTSVDIVSLQATTRF